MDLTQPLFIDENKVKSLLSWTLVIEAVEEALKSAPRKTRDSKNNTLPFSYQPARSFTFTENNNGVLLSMPGYVGNYSLNGNLTDTLACKLVTSFKNNENQKPPLPNILANILLFDSKTGKLKCVMEGTEITAWRTAAASIVATKYLYYQTERRRLSQKPILAVIGCGVQGRIHAIGFGSCFELSEIRLWNRTKSKASTLAFELTTQNKIIKGDPKITISSTIEMCLLDADIIITATFTSEPLIYSNMLKSNVHINAVGAGVNHYSEISEDTYEKSKVYIDNWESANTELKGLKADIVCEIGEIITGSKASPEEGITIFQSMGMASEDATVAQAVFNSLK